MSPPFDSILSGCSVKRAFALAQSALEGREGAEVQRRLREAGLRRAAFRHVTAEEAKAGVLELIKFGVGESAHAHRIRWLAFRAQKTHHRVSDRSVHSDPTRLGPLPLRRGATCSR